MSNKKIIIFILLITILLWIIISEIKSFNKEYPETEKNTKIHGRNALYNAIIGLLIVFYFIYNEIKDLI
jgi:Na+-driven multidrug efflux pump|tara:strand:+ start:65 stop:271 length:207 start_codon:yes stop_codon:yes gene_type:complete